MVDILLCQCRQCLIRFRLNDTLKFVLISSLRIADFFSATGIRGVKIFRQIGPLDAPNCSIYLILVGVCSSYDILSHMFTQRKIMRVERTLSANACDMSMSKLAFA